ncbi:MAG: ATP phosphoribosyltransferase regulatory subunit [Polyangiales bacterium]
MDDPLPPLRFDAPPLGLPVGMRDMLPARAALRRSLARAVMGAFERRGYDPVVPPAFEREDVLLRGLGPGAASSLLRLVDPDSGEVLALRPDMTPQIARIVATHYRGAPSPVRLAYEGTVLRRPRGRARRHRQVAQAGVECVGAASVDADAEVVATACEALAAAGVADARVEVSHAGVHRALLAAAPGDARQALAEALEARDRAAWRRALRGAPAVADAFDALAGLAGGGAAVVRAAAKELGALVPARVFEELGALVAALDAEGVAGVQVDLAEARGDGYYTGATFAVVCEGAGEAVASGGRYDELLARYGAPAPATGCAVALETLEALVAQRKTEDRSRRAVVTGEASRRRPVAAALRRDGWHVAELDACDEGTAQAWAKAHGRARVFAVDVDGTVSEALVP